MTKLFESNYQGFDESASKVSVYQFDDEREISEFEEMTHDERCTLFNVFDMSGYCVAPGALYKTFDFHVENAFVIMTETAIYNV